ncbi:SLX1 (YBR228W) [Zygosaccharomyces parabailii]|nr:SLX1 (YBR228W) [Zygosaccharomyces parabailii]
MSQKIEDEQPKPVPIFYCCYLLQSVCKRQSFYIGSTPNPVRRLRQHNGILNRGGAYRTKRQDTRPWEMIMFVYGFLSKIAALQFEHAWQHGYSTHYIEENDRIVKSRTGGRSIHHKLGTARLLANNTYFKHMNLVVHFFNNDVENIWKENKFKIVDSIPITVKLLQNRTVTPTTENAIVYADGNLKLVEDVYNDYVRRDVEMFKLYQDRLSYGEIRCGICQSIFDYTSENVKLKPFLGFCGHRNCNFIAHLGCLHRYFLDEGQLNIGTRNLIPKKGRCPDCSAMIEWGIMVKYSTMLKASFGK